MVYRNPSHQGRMVIIPVVENAYASLCHAHTSPFAQPVSLVGCDEIFLNLIPDGLNDDGRHVYNMPFLFDPDGFPWHEGNAFCLYLVEEGYLKIRPTDNVRRKAIHLLEYKLFCESINIDYMDFSGKRSSHRPTYKYFRHLAAQSLVDLNQRTATIYKFYEYLVACGKDLDIERVDTYKNLTLLVKSSHGHLAVDVKKRSQTVRKAPKSEISFGFIRDGGEDLRPLSNKELKELLTLIQVNNWSQLERLLIKTAITTGARKQTILTLRVKHLHQMKAAGIRPDGSYRLHVGPKTGADTKYNKKQTLYIPSMLFQELCDFVEAPSHRIRQRKFIKQFKEQYPERPIPSSMEAYIFLSDQGNCYYMAKDDQRYPFVRTPAIGQMTDHIKKKILENASDSFPTDFTFHWLRATFAYLLYQWLLPFVKSGQLKLGEEIAIIQKRMHHENRETTETYLKVFLNLDEKIFNQEIFESKVFSWGGEELELDLVSESL